MEIGTRQHMNAAIVGTAGAGLGIAVIAPQFPKHGGRLAGAIVAGGLASSLVAAAIVPNTTEEASNGVKAATYAASVVSGGAIGAVAAGAMGLRGGFMGAAALGAAGAGLFSAMTAIATGPMSELRSR